MENILMGTSPPGVSLQFKPESIAGTIGFFRVGQSTSGQWWLLDPNNCPFYYKGVTSVNRAGTPGGRDAIPGQYAPVVDAKYNWQHDKSAFVNATVRRLRNWNFNAFGSWTTEEFFRS